MAQGNIEASRQQPGKSGTEAQSDERRRQAGEQQAPRGLQRRSPDLPFGPLGFAGLTPFSVMRRVLPRGEREFRVDLVAGNRCDRARGPVPGAGGRPGTLAR